MLDTKGYPFRAQTKTLDLAPAHQRWWKKNRPTWKFPVQVTFDGRFARIADSHYELVPDKDGFACRRPRSTVLVGRIYPYGVRQTLTPSLHKELSMLRAALWDKSYPAPICYDLADGTRVHPGPCLEQHTNPHIVRPCYALNEKRAYECAICGERFL